MPYLHPYMANKPLTQEDFDLMKLVIAMYLVLIVILGILSFFEKRDK